MKPIIVLIAFFLNVNAFSQSLSHDDSGKDSVVSKWTVEYDPKVFRFPRNKLPIGISEKLQHGKVAQTSGYLKGKVKWKNFSIEVQGGTFRNGKIRIADTNVYLKGKSLVVRVYRKKSSTLLFTQNIPYNYETQVHLLTKTDFEKVPGSAVKYGVRTVFDNGHYEDLWPTNPKLRLNFFSVDSTEIRPVTSLEKPLGKFIISSNGGYFLKRYMVIENDPFKIKNHTAWFTVSLAKNPTITDTLKTVLNYISHYTFDSRFVKNYCLANSEDGGDHKKNPLFFSSGYYGDRGHNLEVYADIYKDSLIKDTLLHISVTDISNCEHYDYLVNIHGGAIKIISHGLDGSSGSSGCSGRDGTSGSDGLSGSSGSISTKTVTNADGTTSTITETGPGGNGSNGSDGENGSDGSDGSNGRDGGDGGDIYFNYTQAVQPYLHLIKVLSEPGSGGSGGSGGAGGKGGSGGHGGSGGSGNPSGSNGLDGRSGSNGRSGSDGSRGHDGNRGKIFSNLVN